MKRDAQTELANHRKVQGQRKRGNRCQGLDMDGKQCVRTRTRLVDYHGDNELYDSPEAEWVRVWLCGFCRNDSTSFQHKGTVTE